MDKLKLAYDYVQACQVQGCYEDQINRAFALLNPDNQIFGLCDPLRKHYEEVVQEILGEEITDWIQYWQYECDYGKESRDVTINGVEYNTQDITLYKYLEVTCGLTKQDPT
jgi:carboxypeptidase C (cathepsin A)